MNDPGTPDPRDLATEIARLRDQLESERRTSEQWRRVAEERRVAMERLRQRRSVRLVFAVAKVVLPGARRLRSRLRTEERRLRRLTSGVLGARHRFLAGRREARLLRQVVGLPAPAQDSRRVVAVVPTRDGGVHLARVLESLEQAVGAQVEVVVVDNASGPETAAMLDQAADQGRVRLLRNPTNASFSDANNSALAAAPDVDAVLLCNDDVDPLDDHWLARMLAALNGDVVAVGAQLVNPRRSLLDGRARDVGVQHMGITFDPDGDGPPRPRHLGRDTDPDPRSPVVEVAAATAACLLVDAAALREVGGLDPGYVYGAEDVDLCWRLRQRGGRIVVAPGAVLWHREGTTRHRDDPDERARRQADNWERFEGLHGPALRRAVDADRLAARGVLSDRPFTMGITVTRDLESAGYGDWYTAHQLGDAFVELGWRVRYLERYRDAWYEQASDVDAILVLHDLFDVRRLSQPGVTTIAWVRNWTDRWTGHPWFDDIDVVVASSEVSAGRIRDGSRHRRVEVLPLATDPSRFVDPGRERDGIVLTANHWGEDRGVAALVEAAGHGVDLYGKGWEAVPDVAEVWRGHLPYEQLPAVYASAAIVLDQTAAPTRPFGALNARVFDAIAAGAMVVTDQKLGAAEVFGDDLPTYDDANDLRAVLGELRADPGGTRARATRLRDRIRTEHTWQRRAAQFRDLLADHRARASVVVRIGAPTRKEAANWGDTFYAEALVAELRAAGHHAITQTMDEWSHRRGRGFDVSLHLKGRSRCPRTPGQVHAVWVISHPDEVDPDELAVADLAFAASPTLARHLANVSGVEVRTLLQATDERRFRPRTVDPARAHDVVFVGNSRFSERPMVRDAVDVGLPLTVYGANWERYLPPGIVAATFVPNDEVPVVYSSSSVVLNDHWPDMARWGLVSNRLFDALACGACVVSDDVDGLQGLVGDAVAVVTEPGELRSIVQQLLEDPDRRDQMGREGRAWVLGHHTFRHRVDDLLAALESWRHTAVGRAPRRE